MTAVVAASGGGGGGGLPSGVSLSAIDGGSSYYCSSGFTYACNDGWDNPSFYPVGVWYGGITSSSDVSIWKDLGWNTTYRTTGADSPSAYDAACASNGTKCTGSWPIYVIEGGFGGDCGSCTTGQPETSGFSTTDPAVVGLMTYDEPPDFQHGVINPLTQTANAWQDHRFWWGNYTYYWVGNGGSSPIGSSAQVLASEVATPNGTLRHPDLQSLDEYWFASIAGKGSGDMNVVYGGIQCSKYNTCNTSYTTAQAACGCRYGDVIDMERAYQTPPMPTGTTCNQSGNPPCATPTPAPIVSLIETGGPDSGDNSAAQYIQPPEVNWAAWSSIIHGARLIMYFDATFSGPGQGGLLTNYPNGFFQQPQNGQTNSMYAQVKATDELIQQLAPYINAPIANNYVTWTPAYQEYAGANSPQSGTGLETRATYDQGQVPCAGTTSTHGCFTIIADYRGPETNTNIPATFTTADHYTGPVQVICDTRTGGDGHLNPGTCVNRTITATNGNFTDTFAKGNTVHIYQIPN